MTNYALRVPESLLSTTSRSLLMTPRAACSLLPTR